MINLRPVLVRRRGYRHEFNLGFNFYKFGASYEHRSLMIQLGRTDYEWEWTR